MLSSEHPSGPSCSSKSAGLGVSADPATSAAGEPASQDPRDLVQPYPKFSIRDYVFASRSKGVKRSWPFHPHSLQLCLKRGVKDPLPPFEPPDLIRSQPLSTFTDVEQSAACSEAIASVSLVKTRDAGSSNEDTSDINFQSCQPVDESFGPSPYTSPEDGKSGIDQVGSTNGSDHTDEAVPIDLQDNSSTKASRTEVAVPSWRLRNLGSSCEPSEKKCKFVVKLGTPTDIRRTEDIASNSSSVSDPMASKTCPVCKVFASTSNTTLNAHIDQCLSAESNTELVETVLVKPKVKPRKKRLLEDIYKTALPYTLEDLDRRNGTNWAVELAMSTVSKEVCTENQSPEVAPFDRRDDEKEGDVYVDSNGIKIRILSKCSDAPLVLRDDDSRKVAKHETGKCILMSKKIPKSKMLKNKKLKMHRKKYNKTNHLNSQVPAYSHDDINEETSEEERHSRNPSGSTSNCGSVTMRRWACSKRSDITKNFSRKFSDKVASGAQKSDRSSMLGFNDSQITESPAGVFSSESPEDMATTSEAIGFEQSNARLLGSIPTWSSKTPLQSGIVPKVPRSAAALAKRKIKEIGRREANKLDNYDIERNPSSAKRSEARSLSFSTAGPSNGPNRLVPTSKKIRKHRSMLRTGKRAFSSSSSRLVHGFGRDHEPDTGHVNKKFRVSNNEGPKKFVKHTEEDTADNDSSFGTDMPESGQQDDQYDVPQETEGTQMYYEGEEPETDVPYDSTSRSNPVDCQISDGSLSPENNRSAGNVLVEGYSVAVEDPSSSEQLAHHGQESNSVVNNETEEWQIDPASTKESSACLTNNRDMGPGAPQDNSSITSNREDSNQEQGLPLGRDSLDSPISTASTMSPPAALKDSRMNESEPGPSTGRTVEERTTGSLNQENKSIPIAREGEQMPNEKPFRCSCQENIARDSNQSAVVRPPMLNFTGKQVPQLHIGLRASSCFSTYQRTSTKPNPCLDTHDHPLAAKVSAESAMNLPSYTADCMSPALQNQLPSPSNPILRLMGKNLMVMNNEESVHPQPPSSDYMLRGNYVAPVGFVPPKYQHLRNSAFINTPPTTASHQMPLPSVQAGSFVGPPLHGGSVMQSDHHALQKAYRNIVPVMHHPNYMMKEVIVIDDSPEHRSEPQVSMLLPHAPSPATMPTPNTMPPQPFYCLPSQSPILPRDRAVGSMPVYANVGSMVGVGSSSQGSQTEVANPYMQNPFFAQSATGYLNQPMYYSQNLRR
ncbi:hypothetical protein SEVIR_7G141600v4 [Setaria viridis]|uniref:Hapless 8 n=1 Tax=Setaria viridis TaxID=4556 RepID=A0A4U6TS96_SETVI|nr:uncharacterized protein LOC117863122 [Setaria viridis]XP_034602610.1 uncharacterized protein LOC117863122 [Setaria viridis]XP_034602611.1 uncharacterized protein LOC117863122 [Setaria viridis]TKW04911.1 hypothetical protein SEVIR_7G141600v2 [Setaria viridis]TKW04912.1 hypothetical protein SEVIR_7G141600v2 [Setaria viridis]TKW04913.1 hypothetical protein SEVIR_7G141600v2 [Setaria viridis]TKW04914.1 hypothetical protein SEVIR_7G141600v2 [Setaria viridis]